ncbi:PolC-type DNA polymerase III [Ilumatobacter sp.]|uniref:3'-5' exonuclease n=1 Tax=Ilumatobacter sp. TaxID=1967498 RepID=UPI003B51C484
MGLPRFAVVDLETSGLRAERHRILQVAMVTVDAHGTVHDEWETFVKLRWPLGRVGPSDVHGITRPMLRDAPRLASVVAELGDRLGDSMFVAHNARFDGAFLERAARRRPTSELARLERRLCTLRMSRRLDPDRRCSHRLGDVCARYGVALDRPHDALHDARATGAILPHLLRDLRVETLHDLEPFLDRAPSRAQRSSRWSIRRHP